MNAERSGESKQVPQQVRRRLEPVSGQPGTSQRGTPEREALREWIVTQTIDLIREAIEMIQARPSRRDLQLYQPTLTRNPVVVKVRILKGASVTIRIRNYHTDEQGGDSLLDLFRPQVEDLGWQVEDTTEGERLNFRVYR